MEVSISTKEVSGGFFKKYTDYEVTMVVRFSDTERYLIEQHGLDDAIIMEVPGYQGTMKFRPRTFYKGPVTWTLKAREEVEPFIAEFKNNLGNMKEHLQSLERDLPDGETFEL